MLWVIFFTLVLILWTTLSRWNKRRILALSRQIKCNIKTVPILGHAHLFFGDGKSRMKTFQDFGREATRQGGITHLWLGHKYLIVIADPVDLEVVLKTCLEKDDLMKFTRELIGNASVIAPVAIWRPRRKVLAPKFSPKNLHNFVEVFSQQSQVMVEQLEAVAGSGPFSLWNYIATYSMDSVCETALGVSIGAQTKVEVPFLKALETCCQLVSYRFVQPLFYSDAVYQLFPAHSELKKNIILIHGFIDKIITSKRKQLKTLLSPHKASNNRKSFLELLIEASGGERGYTNLELQEETLLLILAGTDTSAAAISFVIAMMARHPDVQEKVYQELQTVLGATKRPIVPEDLPHLKYMDAVIRETLRLYPPVPIVVRKVEKDVVLPSGITLVDGCGVFVNIWAVHRNPKYWGADAEQFRPERFFEAPLKHPAAFMAFSYGPRNCLGYQYAMMSMKTALATLLTRYRVLHKDKNFFDCIDETPITVTFDVMMKDADRYIVQLENRL